MNWDAISAVGEIIGAAGVIASLFYIGYQVRQNTIHSRAYTQRDILCELTNDHLRGGDMAPLFRRALSDFNELTDDEKLEIHSYLLTVTNRFEASLRLYNIGLVDESLFIALRAWILAHILSVGGNQWWEAVKHNFSEDVRSYLDKAMIEKIDLPIPITIAMPFYGVSKD
jgi:hypothetical protein